MSIGWVVCGPTGMVTGTVMMGVSSQRSVPPLPIFLKAGAHLARRP